MVNGVKPKNGTEVRGRKSNHWQNRASGCVKEGYSCIWRGNHTRGARSNSKPENIPIWVIRKQNHKCAFYVTNGIKNFSARTTPIMHGGCKKEGWKESQAPWATQPEVQHGAHQREMFYQSDWGKEDLIVKTQAK